jgi:hypothetical protein
MQTDKVMALARKHIGKGTMESSARLCLSDANHLFDRGLIDYAKEKGFRFPKIFCWNTTSRLQKGD